MELPLLIFSRNDVYFGKELADGAGDPTLQSLGGKLALRASTPEAHFDCIALNTDQLNRTVMKLLDISADLLNQGADVFFAGIIRGNVFSHDELLRADGFILSCLPRNLFAEKILSPAYKKPISIKQPALQQMFAEAPAMMRTEPILLYCLHVLLGAVAFVLTEAIVGLHLFQREHQRIPSGLC